MHRPTKCFLCVAISLLSACLSLLEFGGESGAQEKKSPLPAEVTAPWEKLEAEVGFLYRGTGAFNGYWRFAKSRTSGEPGIVPALRLVKATDVGVLKSLPEPEVAYGLELEADDAILKELAGKKQLRYLNIVNRGVTDRGLKELAGLKQLELLVVAGNKVTDAGLKNLAEMKQLRFLYLGATQVTDAGLKELAGLERLETLDLNMTAVTDAGLKELVGLKQLKTLMLRQTKVGDAGLKHLGGLEHLTTLWLTQSTVTDAGLSHLTELKNLVELDVLGTKVTRKRVEELKRALPKLLLVYGGVD